MDGMNNAEQKKEEREQVVELGSDITKSSKGNIYTLTIIEWLILKVHDMATRW